MAISTRFYRTLFTIVPFLLLVAGFLFEITAIRVINQGRFIYSLDDPYIHLALAQRIAQGHYGINLGEVSAPSSSILWPFLLAPFAGMAFYEYVPLAINFLAAAGTLFLYIKVVQAALEPVPEPHALAATAWIPIFLIPATNLIGLAFTGLEHSLQVFLCAGVVLGTIRVARNNTVPWWFIAALILAPTVRYESLAVCLPALGLLLYCRRWKAAGIALAGMLLPLAAFSLYLHANGLGWLPTSVIAKVSFAGYKPTPHFIQDHIINNLALRQGRVLGLLFVLFLALAIFHQKAPKIDRVMALLGAAAVLAHLSAGQIGWWDRYEIYMIVASFLLAIYLTRGFFQRLFWTAENTNSWRNHLGPMANLASLALLLGMAWYAGQPYFENFVLSPLASANIYEQQYQMHRFVVDYLKAQVAVNDLGWVSFGNPNYVLDLWGLASAEALKERTSGAGSEWMDRLSRQHNVRLVMIYEGNEWLPFHPQNWVRVARLHLGRKRIVAGGDTVSFYVPDAAKADSIRTLLETFLPTLPPGVRMDIEQ